jgi:GxxExxY protein
MFVHQELTPGYLEITYQSALAAVFEHRKIPYRREVPIAVWFMGKQLDGTYRADFECFGDVLVEIKALPTIGRAEVSQLAHYLTATGKQTGLLLNFGSPSLQFQRVKPRRSTVSGPDSSPAIRGEVERIELGMDPPLSIGSAQSQVPQA